MPERYYFSIQAWGRISVHHIDEGQMKRKFFSRVLRGRHFKLSILKNLIPDETMGVKLNIDNGGSGENSLSNYATYKLSPDHQDIKPFTSIIPNDPTFCSPSYHRNKLFTPQVRNFTKKRKYTCIDHIPEKINGMIMTSGSASSIYDRLDLIDSLEEDQSDLKLTHLISPAQLLSGMRSSRPPLKLRRKPTAKVYLPNALIFCPSDHRNQFFTPPVRKPNKKKKYRYIDQIPYRISGVSMTSRGASINDCSDLIDSLEKDQYDLNESKYVFSPAQPLSDVYSTRAPIKLRPRPTSKVYAQLKIGNHLLPILG